MSTPIGIDLGTTNSVVTLVEGGQPKVLVNSSDRLLVEGKAGDISTLKEDVKELVEEVLGMIE